MHVMIYTANWHIKMEAKTKVIQLQGVLELLATNASCKGQEEILCGSLANVYMSVIQRLHICGILFQWSWESNKPPESTLNISGMQIEKLEVSEDKWDFVFPSQYQFRDNCELVNTITLIMMII